MKNILKTMHNFQKQLIVYSSICAHRFANNITLVQILIVLSYYFLFC